MIAVALSSRPVQHARTYNSRVAPHGSHGADHKHEHVGPSCQSRGQRQCWDDLRVRILGCEHRHEHALGRFAGVLVPAFTQLGLPATP